MNTLRRFALFALVLATFAITPLARAQSSDADSAKAQALNLFKIYRSQDWKALFDNLALPEAVAKANMDRDTFAVGFAKGLKDNDPNGDFEKLMDNLSDISVGTAIIEGNAAYVCTSCSVAVGDDKVKFLGIVKLIKVDDIWKWDLTTGADMEKATEQRFKEIIGDPAKS